MTRKVYPFRNKPEKYPEFDTRACKVVTHQVLNDKIQFTSLRRLEIDVNSDGKRNIVNLEQTIEAVTKHFRLGNVMWLLYDTLFADNFKELVDLCVKEELYLYSFWAFVPGMNPESIVGFGEYTIPSEVDKIMREQMCNNFFGYENGEQDGRYVSFSSLQLPSSDCRKTEYERFQKYFEKLNDNMLNYTSTLSSLTFVPYFAKEGNTSLIGAETAQALPCNNMWYSIIRGAGKQYGLLWYGNASVYNRWGYKEYSAKPADFTIDEWGAETGIFAGASLSLMKKLMYNQYMYDCDMLGFENNFYFKRDALEGEASDETKYVKDGKCYELTPIGLIQQRAADFIEKYGRAGVMYTPIAMMLDFHACWVPARHLYTGKIYQVWGSLPYNTGDFQTHCLFSMFYPHYEDSGFYRNEQGFEAPTPYGEILDVLLSDAAPEILSRYPVLIITEGVVLNKEILKNLRIYAENGGTLIAFAGNVSSAGFCELFGAKNLISRGDGYYDAEAYGGAEISDIIIKSKLGKGETILFLHEHGMEETGEALSSRNEPNEPICQPYSLLKDVKEALTEVFNENQIIKVTNPSLHYITAIKSADTYTFMVSSPAAQDEYFDIVSDIGEIVSVEELLTTDCVEELPEFLPYYGDNPGVPCKADGEYVIHPGCIRIFRIVIREANIEIISEAYPQKREGIRYLSLPAFAPSMKRALLDLPTFKRHFDGFMISASYLEKLDIEAVRKEAHYMNLQNVHIAVDFAELINHYPDISLVRTFPDQVEGHMNRIGAILDKAMLYKCDNVIFIYQRKPEGECTTEQCDEGFIKSIDIIRRMCDERGLKLSVRNRFSYHSSVPETVFDISSAIVDGNTEIPNNTELVMMSNAYTDRFGQIYATSRPLVTDENGILAECRKQIKERNLPVALTASYNSWDEIFDDLEWLEE